MRGAGREERGENDEWVPCVRREIKDDECRRNKYKGENLADQTRIFRFKGGDK
jgi:hypothetical protein